MGDRASSIFDVIDADKSGEIEPAELVMHLLGLGQDHESVSELFAALDTDGDGKISREEFIAGFDKLEAEMEPEAEAAAAATFAAVDADKSGKLDLEELLSALAAAGDDADRAEVEALFKRLDVNGDGAITMEEWRAGHSGGGLRARLDAAMKRGQLSLPPPDEDDEPEPEGKDEDGVPLAAKQAAKAIRELDPPDPAHPDDRLAAAGYAEQYSLNYGNWGVSPWYGQPYEHMSPSDSDDETEEIEDKRRRNEDRGGGGRGASPRWMRSARPRYAGRRERSSSWRRTMQSSSGRSST